MRASEGHIVVTPVAVAFDQLLGQHGDDLYRLAIMLCGAPRAAAPALRRAARALHAAGGEPSLDGLFAALLAVVPAERRQSARTAADPAAQIQAALMQLPRPQRLAVALPALRSFEDRAPPPAVAASPAAGRALRRSALLTLAERCFADLPLVSLDPVAAPEACRAVRAALAADDAALTEDSALRGHLGLCAECRAAAHTWHEINGRVTDTLRGALRPQTLPPALALELRAIFDPSVRLPRRMPRWVRIALVPLAVLAIIGFIVLPRAPASPQVQDVTPIPGGVAAGELVARARTLLYQPPAGNGIWHARYRVRWAFPDQSVTDLDAGLWRDTSGERHRAQLVHISGGAPYEFALADDGRFSYALAPLYSGSVAPLLGIDETLRLQMPIERGAADLLAARLASGAWGIADAYLRQAEAAQLQSWGRRTADDGATLEVIGFRGVSPLATDAAPGAAAQVTVLMSLDAATGMLYEVREVIDAPGGGAPASRTTWRFLGAEWLGAEEADAALSQRSLSSVGNFTMRADPPADAQLPMLRDADLLPLVFALTDGAPWVRLPAAPPPMMTQALLVASSGERSTVAIYRGEGRTLTIRTQPRSAIPATLPGRGDERERIDAGEVVATIAYLIPDRAEALLDPRLGPDGIAYTTHVVGVGFARDEFRSLVVSLTTVTTEIFREQSALFSNSAPAGEVGAALLGALARETMPAGGAQRTVARTMVRRNPAALPLADPFSLPPYGGRPATTTTEVWMRSPANAASEVMFRRSDEAGRLYEQVYVGPTDAWWYDAARSQVGMLRFGAERTRDMLAADTGRRMVVQFLHCAAGQLAPVDGMRALELVEPEWQSSSCVHPEYAETLRTQRESRSPYGDAGLLDAQRPFLADLPDGELTTRLFLNERGRVDRVEVRAGAVLIESWELVREEHLAAGDIPAAAFDPTRPDALVVDDNSTRVAASLTLDEIPVDDARASVATPLFTLGDADAFRLAAIERVTNAAHRRIEAGDPFEAAFWSGNALRMTYINNLARGTPLRIYQGEATRFGAYLRAQARWAASEAVAIDIEEYQIAAWQITMIDGQRWRLVLIDGTLIAIPANDPQQEAIPAALRQIAATPQ
jgi:hypothetical protein